ncbi:replication fork protection component Swi3 [Cordyceps fumosorosea ARSEF 2679]|uniref:Chromosome segregation in meiosis protein n=1 Tax=Cordyceps fumosorosea (strain ARSEF 2679) TaxID=1081104 RepID=A0A167HJ40_CORFA|nr:replication fork protection component Swi3 [Cordyceps fumosorosea ARSEF 2679]OAA47971.1 replication fork protection component Swi3 [Cordyceps fumosorosea ARSEF 2679]
MPAATKPATKPAGRSQHDELDNYDVDDFSDDPFATPSPPSKNKRKSEAAGLGIDEEVDVKKKARQPTVKLDEERLLSDAGIPTLRRRAQGLKFKGKGHEFSDMTRLLSFYQRWLDDLYPKARFLDALAMVEKAGHKKRLVDARKAWREENDPNRQENKEDDPFDLEDRPDTTAVSLPQRPSASRLIQGLDGDQPPRPRTPTPRDHPDDFDEEDLYDVTPRAARGRRPGLTAMQPDAPDNDDLDALMAEAEGHDSRPPAARTTTTVQRRLREEGDGDDLDDLIAEAEEQDARPKSIFGNPTASKPAEMDWDDDEAALREMEGF